MNPRFTNRLKNYSFWVSLASAILLLVQAIGKPLGLIINEEIYMSIVNSVLGVFVVLGIISHPAQNLINQNYVADAEIVKKDKKEKVEKSNNDLKHIKIYHTNTNKQIQNLTETTDNKSSGANCENFVDVDKTNDVISVENLKYQILQDCAKKDYEIEKLKGNI